VQAYTTYTVQDFVLDEFFQHWVFNPNDQDAHSFWNSWLKEHPEKETEVRLAREILLPMRFSHYQLDREGVVNLWQKIRTEKPAAEIVHNHGYWAAAAAVILVVCVGVIYWFYQPAYQNHATAYGETQKIVLPDNSVVMLNANSTLRYRLDLNKSDVRELWVDGEAYFTVVSTNDNKLFKVHTGDGVTVEVLGTSFNVYNRHQYTKVVLASGKIQLQLPTTPGNERIVMEPGEMVEYYEKRYTRQLVNPVHYSAWTDNRLELDHTTLLQLIELVRDNYGLSIEVAEKELLTQTVSGSMPYGDANSLLQQIAKSFQLAVRKDGDVFYLEEKH
jgi:transmembrane sensor